MFNNISQLLHWLLSQPVVVCCFTSQLGSCLAQRWFSINHWRAMTILVQEIHHKKIGSRTRHCWNMPLSTELGTGSCLSEDRDLPQVYVYIYIYMYGLYGLLNICFTNCRTASHVASLGQSSACAPWCLTRKETQGACYKHKQHTIYIRHHKTVIRPRLCCIVMCLKEHRWCICLEVLVCTAFHCMYMISRARTQTHNHIQKNTTHMKYNVKHWYVLQHSWPTWPIEVLLHPQAMLRGTSNTASGWSNSATGHAANSHNKRRWSYQIWQAAWWNQGDMIIWMGEHGICQDTAKKLKKTARKRRKRNKWSLIMVPFSRVLQFLFTAHFFLTVL